MTLLILGGATPASLPAGGTFPTIVIEFSPGTGPFDTPVWVDISTYAIEAEWTFGTDRDLEDFPPGEASLILANDDRRFDPDNTSGPYYGDLLPRVPFRIRATISTTTFDLFYGYVEDGWEQTYQPPGDATCTVQLVDMLGVLEGYTLPGVLDAAILALNPAGFWPLDETSHTVSVADLTGRTNGTTHSEPDFGQPPLSPGLRESVGLDGVDDRIDLTRAKIITDEFDCTVVAVVKTGVAAETSSVHPIFTQNDGAGPGADDAVMLYVDTDGLLKFVATKNGAGSAWQTISVVDDIPHLVFGQYSPTRYGVAVDTAALTTTSATAAYNSGNGTAIGGSPNTAASYSDNHFEGRVSNVAVFNGHLLQAQRQTIVDAFACMAGDTSDEHIKWALDEIGVPFTMYDLDVGATVMGAAQTKDRNALEFIREVAATEQGGFYVNHHDGGRLKFRNRYASWLNLSSTVSQATFTDDPAASGLRVEPGTLVVEPNGVRSVSNQVKVSWAGGAVTESDATSIGLYGPRGQTVDTVATTAAQARGVAQWQVALKKTPKTRIRGLGVDAGADLSAFPDVLALQVGDRVTYRSQPNATGSVVTSALEILGGRHRVAGVNWDAEFYTTAAPNVGVDLFILGTSTLGGSHILAY